MSRRIMNVMENAFLNGTGLNQDSKILVFNRISKILCNTGEIRTGTAYYPFKANILIF